MIRTVESMLDSKDSENRIIGQIIRSLLAGLDIAYKVPPSDNDLHQACIDEATRRGYPMDGSLSLRKYLQHGVKYAFITSPQRADRPGQIWMALYTAGNYFVDDAPARFPSEIPNIYLFNDRFIKMQKQGNVVLDALADTIRQASDLFPSVLANFVVTSSLNFVTTTLLEYETKSMQISSAAKQYPIYQRNMSGFTDAYIFMVFPREIPLTAYIQAIPELRQFINDTNDVLSFYKEEFEGEDTNQISLLAVRNKESKMVTLHRMAGTVTDHYKCIVAILEGFPEARDAFQRYAIALFEFHFAVERYKLAELNL